MAIIKLWIRFPTTTTTAKKQIKLQWTETINKITNDKILYENKNYDKNEKFQKENGFDL